MTREDSIKWLENLKEAMGESQYQGLWHYEQALAETIELLQSDRLVELPCKVGSDFYVLTVNDNYCFKCKHFYEDYCEKGFKLFPDFDDFGKDRFCKKHYLKISKYTNASLVEISLYMNEFDKRAFADKSKAEAKLKELLQE